MYGAFVIDSIPPVTTTSTSPARIIESAISTARIDDAHTLLIVSAGTSIGSPAATAAWRAGACPAPPWSTWPMITYCTSPGSTPARSRPARIATAPSCGASYAFSPPPSFPNGVRTAPTITLLRATRPGYKSGARHRHETVTNDPRQGESPAPAAHVALRRRCQAPLTKRHERGAKVWLAHERVLAREPPRERDDELHDGLHIVERAGFARRVHVARRHRDQAGRDPGAREVDLVRVGRRRARVDLVRVRDPLLLRCAREQLVDVAVDRRPARDHRPHAELDLPRPPRVSAGDVVRRGDVDRDRDLRIEPERRRARAVEPDLLLHRGDRDDVDLRVARLGNSARRLERDKRAEPVVEGTRHQPPVRKLDGLSFPEAGVADADHPLRVVARARA